MRIAHLIMAHKEPQQVARLVKAMAFKGFDFYVHLDKKADAAAFEFLRKIPHVHFIENRTDARWASFRFPEAILQSVKEILNTEIEYNFINLMSAQDYPIKPIAEIYHFFEQRIGSCFLSFEPVDSEWWKHAITRIEKYHTTYFQFKGQYKLQSMVNWLLPKRQFPLPYKLYGGMNGSWWTISRTCARYLVDFVDNNPKLRNFARFTWGPDEFLIATIIMNSPFRHTVVNNNYRYIDWSAGGANPKVLTAADFAALRDSDMLFARKFDVAVDTGILDQLDELITRQPAKAAAPPAKPPKIFRLLENSLLWNNMFGTATS